MKKKLVVVSILLGGLISTPALASSLDDYACVLPYDLSGGISTFMTRMSGANLAASKVAAGVLKSKITQNAAGKFKVRVDSYSVSDLKAGRFRGVEITGKNVIAQGVHFSSLNIETLCDFNYIVYDKVNSSVVFKESLPLSFSVTLSEDDLNNTMNAAGYLNLIEKMNNFGKKYSLFEIVNTTSWIKDNKFIYAFDVKVPLLGNGSAYRVALRSDLMVEEDQVVMKNPELINVKTRISLSKLTKAFDYLNPFEYSLKVMEDKKARLTVRNVNIVNNKINISGIINVPKDVLVQHKD